MNKCPECGCHLIDLDSDGYACSGCSWDNVPEVVPDKIIFDEVVEKSISRRAFCNTWKNINAVLHRPIEIDARSKCAEFKRKWHEIKDASCKDKDVTVLDLIRITCALWFDSVLFPVVVLGGGITFAIWWTWYCFGR
jgi:hypothetical protein